MPKKAFPPHPEIRMLNGQPMRRPSRKLRMMELLSTAFSRGLPTVPLANKLRKERKISALTFLPFSVRRRGVRRFFSTRNGSSEKVNRTAVPRTPNVEYLMKPLPDQAGSAEVADPVTVLSCPGLDTAAGPRSADLVYGTTVANRRSIVYGTSQ